MITIKFTDESSKSYADADSMKTNTMGDYEIYVRDVLVAIVRRVFTKFIDISKNAAQHKVVE